MNEYLNFPGKELNVPIIQSNNFFKKKQRNQSQLLETVVEGDQKALFQKLQHRGVGEGATPFPGK